MKDNSVRKFCREEGMRRVASKWLDSRETFPQGLAFACSREVTFVDSALKRGFATMPAKIRVSEFLSFPICSPFPFLSRWYIPGVKLFLYSNILSLRICIQLSTIIGNYEIIFNRVKDLFRCLSLTENVRESVNRVESANSTLSLYNVKINFSMKKFLIEKIK